VALFAGDRQARWVMLAVSPAGLHERVVKCVGSRQAESADGNGFADHYILVSEQTTACAPSVTLSPVSALIAAVPPQGRCCSGVITLLLAVTPVTVRFAAAIVPVNPGLLHENIVTRICPW